MSAAFDEGLIAEFLTEANELIEQLDGDLVTLETEPQAPGLLDQIFRALHTIKGAASFLNLAELIEFAHAAEDALNALRKGEAPVDDTVTDALLRSVDILREQLDELANGASMTPGPTDLIARLHAIADSTGGADQAPEQDPAPTPQPAEPQPSGDTGPTDEQLGAFGGRVRVLALPPEKADLVDFMADDIADLLGKLDAVLALAEDDARQAEAGELLEELGEPTRATADFFDFESLATLAELFKTAGKALASLPAAASAELVLRLRAARLLVDAVAGELSEGRGIEWSLETFALRVDLACAGEADTADPPAHDGTPEGVLASDGIGLVEESMVEDPSAEPAPTAEDEPDESPGDAQLASEPAGAVGTPPATAPTASSTPPASPATPPASDGETPTSKSPGVVEQTVRVEVSRLESLLNLVGEMVLTKNQVLGHARQLRDADVPQELREQINTIAGDLDRLSGELQMSVMRTRMQPLSKLFGRYPRIIRDLARKTGKKVDLIVDGGDTEVDKSVLELLGDPLVHMLRNSVDHGVETPDERREAGKPDIGVIHLSAKHQGGHVRVTIQDNGRGIDRAKIAEKAVERGLTTPELAAQMSDGEVFKFIFAAGFSTAVQVSDLSGRGVGMDVVRTNIAKLSGQVNVFSTLGEGTTMEILIPLTVAIMPAMMVGVGAGWYAIPIMSIHEIVRTDEANTESIRGTPAIRLREEVLPLIDLRPLLEHVPTSGDSSEQPEEPDARFAVVVGVGEQKAGLVVDRLGGQQEVVIKPLEDEFVSGGCLSGATILEDGSVSFILDVIKIVRGQESNHVEAAASATEQ